MFTKDRSMQTVVLDDPKGQDALRKAKDGPVRVEAPDGEHGFLLSDRMMRAIRERLRDQLIDATGLEDDINITEIEAMLLSDAGEPPTTADTNIPLRVRPVGSASRVPSEAEKAQRIAFAKALNSSARQGQEREKASEDIIREMRDEDPTKTS